MKMAVIKIPRAELTSFLRKVKGRVQTNTEQYVSHFITTTYFTVKIYENSKNPYLKAVINGTNFESLIAEYESNYTEKKNNDLSVIAKLPQIGSDEVGFGDFFGPLVVVSCFVDESIMQLVKKYDIRDSKKIEDSFIMQIGPLLVTKVEHIKNIVDNDKYNELIKLGYNMNKIKAMLHVNVLSKLQTNLNNNSPLYLDKFCSEENFKKYTIGMNYPHIELVEKGEDRVAAIALASVLARYYFLVEMAKIERRFNTKIPLGAGKNVDIFVEEFLRTNGPSALKSVTKHNFRNFKDLALND